MLTDHNGRGWLVKKFDGDRVARVVAKALSRDFENIEIITVNVARDVGRDGGEILRIEVVFEGTMKGQDARQVAGAARRLRPILQEEVDTDLYPLLSFVSKVDYDRGHRRSAGD
jgi:hypothetical protein